MWIQPPLIPLVRDLPGVNRWLPLHDGVCDADFEVDTEVMELPHAFRTTLESIPGPVPYIAVSPAPLRLRPGRLAVGLVWRAGTWNPARSLSMHELGILGEVRQVDWHLLQRGPERQEHRPPFGRNSGADDTVEAARRIAGLDLLISVDSMPAHLGGALGVPVWLLLKKNCDWRWMDHREDSPWYPTMRLFRQTREADWTSVLTEVARELTVAAIAREPDASVRFQRRGCPASRLSRLMRPVAARPH